MNYCAGGSVASSRPNLPLDRLAFDVLELNDDTDILWAGLTWRVAERWQLWLGRSVPRRQTHLRGF